MLLLEIIILRRKSFITKHLPWKSTLKISLTLLPVYIGNNYNKLLNINSQILHLQHELYKPN